MVTLNTPSPYPKCDDGTMGPDHILHRWHDLARQASQVTGRDLFIGDSMKEVLESAGLVDVVEKRFAIPIGPWSSDENYRQIGRWYKLCWITGMETWIMALCTRHLNVSILFRKSHKCDIDRSHIVDPRRSTRFHSRNEARFG